MMMSKRPLRDVVELLAQPLDGVDEIAGEHQDAALREQFGRLLLQPLDARPDRDEATRSPGTAGTAPAAASR